METEARRLAKLLGSGRVFKFTLLLFMAETGWLALTSRFPMAFDEAYHFGLIQFFGHHLNPIITNQASVTYKFGAIIQDPSFLYHYLMSFPYRFIALFTNSLEIQVISLRFINIALAVAGLLVMRKLLRLLRVSDGLANLIMLAFALTPIVAVLSAQINYDNLLIPAVSVCVYETVSFIKALKRGVFDTKRLLVLLCLCLFSSLIKFAFLPVFATIVVLIVWKIASYWRLDAANLMAGAKKSFAGISRYTKLLLLTGVLLGSFLFARFYVANLIKYRNPIPQCDQVLSVQDCQHYYAWNSSHTIRNHNRVHQITGEMNILQYSAYWFMVNTFAIFGVQVPVHGDLYFPLPYSLIIGLLSTAMLICTVINFKKMMRENRDLMILAAVSFIYLLSLWARNYHDYLQVGLPVALHGRYMLPVLIYVYILLSLGLRQALKSRHAPVLTVKAVLALTVVFSFAYYGGFSQYIHYVDPIYGPLNSSNHFTLDNASTAN